MLEEKRIFIVEDRPENLAVAKMLLEKYHAQVGFDRWGREMMERLHRFRPVDLILLDLMFPNNITGYDLFDLIRADAAFTSTPIVAVSAADPSIAIPKAQSKGFAGFIAKPIDYDLFPEQVKRILAGEPVWMAK